MDAPLSSSRDKNRSILSAAGVSPVVIVVAVGAAGFFESASISTATPPSVTLRSVLAMAYILSPPNALAYNSRTQNLSNHGLHPRITHRLVNLPMMCGTLASLCYLATVRGLWATVRRLARGVTGIAPDRVAPWRGGSLLRTRAY